MSKIDDVTYDSLTKILAKDPSKKNLNLALRALCKWRATMVTQTILAKQGAKISSGPFRGMIYDVIASEGARAPRLLGIYETSLHSLINDFPAAGYAQVFDIGCAEGYYAVGLARLLDGVKIHAYDIDENARKLCKKLAAANDVSDSVDIRAEFTVSEVDSCQKIPSLVICDIEGMEKEILVSPENTGFEYADILVETHPAKHKNMIQLLTDRYKKTHKITRIDRENNLTSLPEWMKNLNDLDFLMAVWEWRANPTPWLWMQSRSRP